MMEELSVSDIIFRVKQNLESNFKNILVKGEISNFTQSSAGHYYFSLIDEESLIQCAVFRMDALRNIILKNLKNGDKVICFGNISVYQKKGSFQLVANKVMPAGTGSLKLQYEQLKQKLMAMGLFDQERKRPIPKLAKKIAISTALNGAALQDFINIYQRRSLWTDIIVIPTLVQGDEASKSIISAMKKAHLYNQKNPNSPIEVIVLARGGGSVEDLWAYNNEALAMEIFQSKIPVISAIGHEVDFSISDFVSDLRAETPSAAAELLTEEQFRLKDKLVHTEYKLKNSMSRSLSVFKQKLDECSPHTNLNRLQQSLSRHQQKLQRFDLTYRLNELVPINEYYAQLDQFNISCKQYFTKSISEAYFNLEKNERLLATLNPNGVLDRGYCFLKKDKSDKVLDYSSFNKLKTDEVLKIVFSSGEGAVRKI